MSFSSVGNGNPGEIFHALITELARNAQAKRSAVGRGKFLAVHAIGKQSLRMQRVGHIQAVPRIVKRKKDDVPGLRKNSSQIQNMRKRHTGPFGNERPPLFAGLMRDLCAGGIRLQFREREGRRAGNQTVDREPPVRETSRQKPLVGFVPRRIAIYRNRL